MTVESSVNYIDDLNTTYPENTDVVSEGAEHVRNIKTAVQQSFPSVAGAVTATHTELNSLDGVPATLTGTELGYVDGVTSSIQTQLNQKRRNLLYNGNFNIWQRGTAFASGDEYTADRWYVSAAIASATRTTDFPPTTNDKGLYCMQTIGDASSTNVDLAQRLEAADSRTLVGQQLTVSFWAKSLAGSSPLKVRLRTCGATDDWTSPALIEATETTPAATPPSTSWTKYTATFSALTTANVQYGLELVIYRATPASADVTRIAQVQLEVGVEATEFELTPVGEELTRCQRFYEKTYNVNIDPGANTTAGADYFFSYHAYSGTEYIKTMPFSVTKRSAPTVTLYSQAGTSGKITNTAGEQDGQTALLSHRSFILQNNGGTFAVADLCRVHWTADAELT